MGNLEQDDDGPTITCVPPCLRGAKHSAIIELLGAPIGATVVHPRVYLNATHEVFLLTLFITWVVTLLWNPKQALDHPALPLIGSLNPCFGWDYPPASYIAMTLCTSNVFLTWRYAWLIEARLFLGTQGKQCIRLGPSHWLLRYSALFLALTTNTWQLLWLIGPSSQAPGTDQYPMVRVWLTHTMLFFAYAVALYLACLGQYIDVAFNSSLRDEIEHKHRVFIFIYTASIVVLVSTYLFDILTYKDGHPPSLPPWITYTAVFLWCGCIAGSQNLMPLGDPLHMDIKASHIDSESGSSQGNDGNDDSSLEVVNEEESQYLVDNGNAVVDEEFLVTETTGSDV